MRYRLLACLTAGSIVILSLGFHTVNVRAQQGTTATGTVAARAEKSSTQPAAPDGPLKLEVMVSVMEVPAILVLRATNVSDKDVTLRGFGRTRGPHKGNYMLSIAPSGKKRTNLGSNTLPLVILKPGKYKEWRYRVGRDTIYMKENGVHRLYWIVGRQRSQEILLSMYPIPPRRGATQPATKTVKPNTDKLTPK